MIITYQSGSSITNYYICEYHKKHPKDITYAGCCCSTTYDYKNVEQKEYNKCDACDLIEMPLCDKCIGA